MLIASMSTPWASISPIRRGPTWSIPGPRVTSVFNPSSACASGITQWACTSITFTRRPPTTTSRRRPVAFTSRRAAPGFARAFPRAAGRAGVRALEAVAASRSHPVKVMLAIVPIGSLSSTSRLVIVIS